MNLTIQRAISGAVAFDQRHRFLGRARDRDLKSGLEQHVLDEALNVLLVLDNQNQRRVRH